MALKDGKKSLYNQKHYRQRKAARRAAGGDDDRKLHYHGMWPQTLLARIQRLALEGVATGKSPWKSTTECVINLLHRGFASMKGDPFIDEMLPHLEITQHLDRVKSLRRESMQILNTAKTEIAALLDINAKSGAITYYHMTMDAANKLPPTEWRDWLITEMQKAFPELSKQKARGITLGDKKKVLRIGRFR